MRAGPTATDTSGRSTTWGRLLDRARHIRDLRGAWQVLRWLAAATRLRVSVERRVAWWHLRSSMRSYRMRVTSPRMTVTAGASAPAFDLRAYHPIGWQSDAGSEAAALGPVERLPPGVAAHRVMHRRNLRRLRRVHHLEDVQAFHADIVTRAGELARLAAAGVVVHLADGDPRLRPLLGDDLYRLMTTDARGMAPGARERLGISMRRAALRDHSTWARARRRGPEELPLVSVLLATRRPRFLPWILDAVARQTYPHRELVLALHGDGFVDVERRLAALPCPARVIRADAREPLGAVLDAAAGAASGTLLTKMDDDDAYGADHLWDLVLAREYSGAELVGKFHEFVYLARSDRTVYRRYGGGERYRTSTLDGGTLLISRQDLHRAGGWRPVPRHVDEALWGDVVRAGGRLYRTHGAGFMLIRHGHRHTWEVSDDWFLAHADRTISGWNPALAGIEGVSVPHPGRHSER